MPFLSNQLLHSTIRIEAIGPAGTSVGTGFFYRFLEHNNEQHTNTPAIVTNRHVVEGATSVELWFSIKDSEGKIIPGAHKLAKIEPLLVYNHPDPAVDLAIVPMAPIVTHMSAIGTPIHYLTLNSKHLPSPEFILGLRALEEIVMVGYPIGLWDSTNNTPLFRRGITASSISLDYLGRREFVIDAAVYPGSSGSPVFLMDDGSFHSQGNLSIGQRLYLLGILYAGPQYTTDGTIEIVEAPTAKVPVSRTNLLLNLGYCIKSERLFEFENVLVQMAGATPPSDWTERPSLS